MLTKLRQSRIVAEMSLDAFGKIFESLYTGSMVRANTTVFALWPYCIAHAKPPGYVEVNPEILAFTMSTTVESIQEALDYLCSPDPRSRSKREGGRRLVKEGEFLYRMVNFIEYRDKISAAAKRENDRARIAAKRAESRKQSQVSQTVVNVAQAEAEAEAEAKCPLPCTPSPAKKQEGGSFSESEIGQLAARLGAIFKRTTPYTAWSQQDQFAFAGLLKRPALLSEISEIEKFKPRYEFFPHSLGRLMEQWDSVLDASRNPDLKRKPKSTGDKQMARLNRELGLPPD